MKKLFLIAGVLFSQIGMSLAIAEANDNLWRYNSLTSFLEGYPGQENLILHRDALVDTEVTIDYEIKPETNSLYPPADPARDFLHTKGQIVWPRGDRSQRAIPIQLVDDAELEPWEYARVVITKVTVKFADTYSYPGNIRIQIMDNERVPGDLNGDLCFDSTDLVMALQSPNYLDDNRDGSITDDLVRLFQIGHYGNCTSH